MEVKISKKSYYLPVNLVEIFKKWCKPGRDYSPKLAGAMLYYMSLNPDVREACEKAAHTDKTTIDKTIKFLSKNGVRLNPDKDSGTPDTLSKQILGFVQDAQSKVAKSKQPQASKKKMPEAG